MITDRVDNITDIKETHKGCVIPAPPSVKIELTSWCDLKCSFCATSKNLRKKGDMDYDFLNSIDITVSIRFFSGYQITHLFSCPYMFFD